MWDLKNVFSENSCLLWLKTTLKALWQWTKTVKFWAGQQYNELKVLCKFITMTDCFHTAIWSFLQFGLSHIQQQNTRPHYNINQGMMCQCLLTNPLTLPIKIKRLGLPHSTLCAHIWCDGLIISTSTDRIWQVDLSEKCSFPEIVWANKIPEKTNRKSHVSSGRK